MTSRAHVYDYSFDGDARRPRRQLRFREDPIVLPKSSIWSTGGGLVAVVVAAGALVVGSAYAAYHTQPATLTDTPSLPLERDWQPPSTNVRAQVTNLLSGPALAVPSVASSTPGGDFETDTPIMSSDAHEMTIDDSAPGAQSRFPQTTPNPLAPDDRRRLVPDPTTTPPDAIAPPNSAPETPTPLLNPENPYR